MTDVQITAEPPLYRCSRCERGMVSAPDGGVCVACEVDRALDDHRCGHCGAPVCPLPVRLVTTSGVVLRRVAFKVRP